jgi:nicotinamide-nucleotide amidase
MAEQPVLHRVAVVSTGTEILQGLYADTNARYLAEQLTLLGMEVVSAAAAPDDEAQVEAALRFAAANADLVICTGGLGPTEDDVNRGAFSRVFGVRLVHNEAAAERMRARFAARGREMPDRNLVQALVPEGATVLQNDWGTAPGFHLPAGGGRAAALIALPGPPKEMIPMFEARVLPILREGAGAEGAFVRTRTIHSFGVPESDLNEKVRELFRRDPAVKFTILAKGYGVDFRVTARAQTEARMNELIAAFEEDVRRRVGERDIYGADDDTMASSTAALLRERGVTIATAESCTGGLVAKLLTDIAGSSAYMVGGVVAYANAAKVGLLGVRPETLARHGAVSAETAEEMALGARRAAGADIGVSLTGIAGPDGGTPEKPVGLVFIGIATPARSFAVRSVFLGDREQVRTLAALAALNLVRRELMETA